MREGTFQHLTARPQDFDVTTALRLAEATATERGKFLEIVSEPTSALRPVPVSRVEELDTEIRITAHLAGLVGPASPLPSAYTEIAAQSNKQRQRGLARFLDLFAARLTVLLIEASEKYRLAGLLQWSSGATGRLVNVLHSIIGLGTDGISQHVGSKSDRLLRFAGLLSNKTRSAEGLRAVLSTFLELPVEIQQFQQRWMDVPEAEQTRVGARAILGQTTMAGAKTSDLGGKIRVAVGPIRQPDFATLEPGQPRLLELQGLIRLYIGPVLDFDIQIILHRDDVPDCQIGGLGPQARLGWNMWAKSEPIRDHSGDAIIRSSVGADA